MIDYHRTIIEDGFLDHGYAKLLRLSNSTRKVWVKDDASFDQNVTQRQCALCRQRGHHAVWRPADRTADNRSHRLCDDCMEKMTRYTPTPAANAFGEREF